MDIDSTSDDEITSSSRYRHILNSQLLQSIKSEAAAKNQKPRIMAGVTMYNEAEDEIQFTMEGILRNHLQIRKDGRFEFGEEELIVIIICDGHEKIPDSFKTFATAEGLYDE